MTIFHPRACTPIPLILFPVPLALRWYLRSLVFIIVCLCLPAQIPPFSSDSSLLPPPCADTVTLTLTHAHARAHKHFSPAHSPPVLVLSHSLQYAIHALTPTWSRGGGVGYIPPRGGHKLHWDWTHLQCKDHKQEDSEAGSRSTNIYPGA